MITIPLTPDLVDGVAELEPVERGMRPHRLPLHVRERYADPQLALMEAQPSGARLAVSTEANRLELEVHATRVSYRMMPRPRGAIDIVIDGTHLRTQPLSGGDAVEIDLVTGTRSATQGEADRIVLDELGPGRKTVEFWLPHNEAVDLVGLRSDAPVEPAPRTSRVWVHHGSSISQGSNTTHPTGIWPVVAARHAGVRLRNLGFGGSALIDPFLARVIRDTPADLISVKLGINVVNLDAMRLRSFVPAVHGFLDTIRDGHPTTPPPADLAAVLRHPRGHTRSRIHRSCIDGDRRGAVHRHGDSRGHRSRAVDAPGDTRGPRRGHRGPPRRPEPASPRRPRPLWRVGCGGASAP